MLVPVILAGGVGSRLWPLSRDQYPKQYIPMLDSHQSLLQLTIARLQGLSGLHSPILLCNEDHRFLVAEQLRQVKVQDPAIMLEPLPRNTAPAIALAALAAHQEDEDAVLLVCPADHLIASEELFQEAIGVGLEQANQGKLVTFGIVPTRPETGYGYVKGDKGSKAQDSDWFDVDQFVEKPDVDTARKYLDSGEYYWNSGIFMFRAATLIDELAIHAPGILKVCVEAHDSITQDLDFKRIDPAIFQRCESESIDYAVMEKTDNAVVVPLATPWNDLGAWDAIWNACEQDADGNACSGDVILKDSKDSYVRAESRLVACVGLENLVVIETADSVLVANKDKVQDVKKIVTELNALERPETINHTQVYRPWGSYESIANAPRFQVKRIIVNPGAALSLQLHHHRAEHWIVVKGRAQVTRDDEVFQLNEDESTYISIGMKHRLENPGKIPLELIEVQTGSYLGEDDIVRFDDQYGRSH